MVTFVRTAVALPGKIFEALAVAKEIAALVKRTTGAELAVATGFGGVFGEIAWVSHPDSLAQMEEMNAKLMGEAEVRTAFKKWETLLVPGASRDHIWVHV